MAALPSGSHLVLAHPAGEIHAAQMAEMTKRVNERMAGPKATTRDRAAVGDSSTGSNCSSQA